MKRFLVLFAMVAFVGTMASAQSTKTCTKSKAACTKSKTACTKAKTVSVASEDELVAVQSASTELPSCPTKAAAKLASMDENITAKTCATSGKVSYYQKNVCAASGKVSLKEVKFNDTSKTFVNVAPPTKKEGTVLNASTPAKKASCKKSCAKTCSKSKAKATGTATQVKLEENK